MGGGVVVERADERVGLSIETSNCQKYVTFAGCEQSGDGTREEKRFGRGKDRGNVSVRGNLA